MDESPTDLLNLEGWKQIKVLTKSTAYRITATFSIEPNSCECGSPVYRHGPQVKLYRDTPIHGKRVVIRAIRQRYRCRSKTCGKTFLQPVDGIHEGRKMTERLITHIQKQAERLTFREVAREIGIDEKSVRTFFEEHAETLDEIHQPETPRVLGIDEVYIKRRSRCVFTNIEEATFVDILESWKLEPVHQFLMTHLKDKAAVELVCVDMHHPYRSAVHGALPQATIIVDKFHVLRLASWALERVRLDIQSTLTITSKRKLMRSKRLLAKRWDGLEGFQRINLVAWFDQFPLLKFTYWLKEAFYDLYQAPNKAKAMYLYDDWANRIPSPLQSAFDPLTKAMHNWRKEIFAYFDHRYTNAVTESLNGIIKLANRQGRGYKFRTLRARLLFTNGVRKIHQQVIPNYGWDRDLVDVVLARVLDLGADFSTILKRLHDGSLLPLSTDHSA